MLSLPAFGSEDVFGLGAGADLGLSWGFPNTPLAVVGGLSFIEAPVPSTGKTLVVASVGAGGGLDTTVAEFLKLRLTATGGWYGSFYGQGFGSSLYAGADAGASFRLMPTMTLGLGASYRHYFTGTSAFLQDLAFRLAVSFNATPERHLPKVQLPAVELQPIFPVFRKYFDAHALGSIKIRNDEAGPVGPVTVSFFIKDYMDAPKVCAEIPSLARGETKDVPLYALLKESILGVTESTMVQATVTVAYIYKGQKVEASRTESERVYHRNAMTWEDDRRAAAFVTPKDPMVLKLAKGVNAAVRDDPSPAASLDFRLALGIFEELGRLGLRYTTNPGASYAEFSVNKFTVDTLQFPRQTLEYKGGDCSDISILYSALLESLGIETAFITVPGHIFLAFAPGIRPEDAKDVFASMDDLILRDGKVWVPVEITMVKDGFLQSWKEGAREWRAAASTRAFWPIHEAWSAYEPVGLPGESGSLAEVPVVAFRTRYATAITAFAEREIAAREAALKAEIGKAQGSSASLNKLGVLYARYGLLDKARAQFEAAAKAAPKGKPFIPALVNLGNLAFMRKEWAAAQDSYEKARQADPNNATVLISLAKVMYETENYGASKALFAQAVALNPALGDKYAWLGAKTDETTRASAADARAAVEWGI